jgi:hypothetical protein
MGIRYLLIVLMLVSCTVSIDYTNNTGYDFEEYMGKVTPPKTYKVIYEYYTSGFSGVDAKQSFMIYDIIDGEPQLKADIVLPTMEEQKEKLREFEFSEYFLFDNYVCFIHEKQFFSTALACFDHSRIVYTEITEYKGNHQSLIDKWQLSTFKLTDEECIRSDGFFCQLFKTAKKYNPQACDTLIKYKEQCVRL